MQTTLKEKEGKKTRTGTCAHARKAQRARSLAPSSGKKKKKRKKKRIANTGATADAVDVRNTNTYRWHLKT